MGSNQVCEGGICKSLSCSQNSQCFAQIDLLRFGPLRMCRCSLHRINPVPPARCVVNQVAYWRTFLKPGVFDSCDWVRGVCLLFGCSFLVGRLCFCQGRVGAYPKMTVEYESLFAHGVLGSCK